MVAFTVTVPAETALTSPVADTVAVARLLEVQDTTRPVRSCPLASYAIALACVVPPTSSDDAPSDTVTRATATTGGSVGGSTGGGGVVVSMTVRSSAPVTPAVDAEILAEIGRAHV